MSVDNRYSEMKTSPGTLLNFHILLHKKNEKSMQRRQKCKVEILRKTEIVQVFYRLRHIYVNKYMQPR